LGERHPTYEFSIRLGFSCLRVSHAREISHRPYRIYGAIEVRDFLGLRQQLKLFAGEIILKRFCLVHFRILTQLPRLGSKKLVIKRLTVAAWRRDRNCSPI
jgi:hypothetical protein